MCCFLKFHQLVLLLCEGWSPIASNTPCFCLGNLPPCLLLMIIHAKELNALLLGKIHCVVVNLQIDGWFGLPCWTVLSLSWLETNVKTSTNTKWFEFHRIRDSTHWCTGFTLEKPNDDESKVSHERLSSCCFVSIEFTGKCVLMMKWMETPKVKQWEKKETRNGVRIVQ